ncbi:MAG TPA: SCO family protein [Polyangiaceae bacterium]|nr:SCO family protein [Polyangiaceae bacterium]
MRTVRNPARLSARAAGQPAKRTPSRRSFTLALALLALGAPGLAGCKRSEPLPDLGEISQLDLLDQDGKPFSAASLRGRPHLAAFFFTRCPSICPRLTARMKEVRARTDARELTLVGISVDPENDTPEVLRAYAQKYGIDTHSWSLLTGPYRAIADVAENGFRIGLAGQADASKPDFGITHGSHLILLDARGHIRGYYRSFDDDVVDRLVADLPRL